MLINQFGSEKRMRMALGVDSLDEVADRIRQFMDVKSPQGFLDKIKMLPMLAEMGKFFPKTVATGPCKEVIRKEHFDLKHLPILQCWPQDAGRFITLPCVVTRDPKTGKRNVGMYRMQVYDGQSTGMHGSGRKSGLNIIARCCEEKLHGRGRPSPPCRLMEGRASSPIGSVRIQHLQSTSWPRLRGDLCFPKANCLQERWKLRSLLALIPRRHFPRLFLRLPTSKNI